MTTNATGPADRRTTVGEPSLTEFLLARVAEDEAVARAAIDPDEWSSSPEGRWLFEEVPYEGEWPRNPRRVRPVLEASSGWTVHCSRHDPARVLAECEAKRAIAHLHGPKYPGSSDCKSCADGWEDHTFGENGYTPEPYPCLTARNLAAVYSDHPDYREEWKP